MEIHVATTREYAPLLAHLASTVEPPDVLVEHALNIPSAAMGMVGFGAIQRRKFEMWISVIESSASGAVVAFADADVQMFGPIAYQLSDDVDLACQRAESRGDLCNGFAIVRCSARVESMLRAVLESMAGETSAEIFNRSARILRAQLLPREFCGAFPVGPVAMHHACYARTATAKLSELRRARAAVG